MTDKKLVFVLGMGRSGTSALTRVLSLRGALLPSRLLDAHDSNQAGHWEPLDALRINDSFLARQGSDWYDPTLRLQERALAPAERELFVSAIVDFITNCPSGPILAIKDPRISGLAQHWFVAAKRAGYEPVVAIAVRHPVEVARSLTARNRSAAELGYLLWLKYNLLAESASRELPRLFIDYAALLGDWRREIGRVERALDLDLGQGDDSAVDAFLRADLHRQRASEMVDASAVSPLVVRLYRELWLAARDGPLDVASIDAVFAEYRLYERMFRLAYEDFQTRFRPESPARTSALSPLDDAARLRLMKGVTQSAENCIFIDDVTIDGKPTGGEITLSASSHLTIRGWAVDHVAGDVGVAVVAIAGERLLSAGYGFARSDVVQTFANLRYLQSGFRFDIPSTSLPAGSSWLRIAMLSASRELVYEIAEPLYVTVNPAVS